MAEDLIEKIAPEPAAERMEARQRKVKKTNRQKGDTYISDEGEVETAPMAPGRDSDDVPTIDTLQYSDDVPEGYVPEGYKTVDDFLLEMRQDYALDVDYDLYNREQAMDDKKFAAGEQWDPIVLEHRKGLPCLVINSVPQFTAQLVGDWRDSRKAIKVVPAADEDTDSADIRGDLIRAIEWRSRASRVYDTCFESMIQCGEGSFRVSVEYERDDVFDQEIYIRPIDDALSVIWDRMSIDPTGRDATHCFVDDFIPKREFDRKWPDKSPSSLNAQMRRTLVMDGWLDEPGVRVTEYWRMIERDRLLCLFQDGTVRFLDKDNQAELIEKHGNPIKTRVSPCSYAQMHLVTGYTILAGPYEYMINRLPIIRMSGRVVNVAGRRIRYGLVRFMKDPVRLKNFWRSVAAEQLGYAPKAQWIATEGAVEGREDTIRRAHMTRDPLLVVNDEAVIGQNIQRLEPPEPQAALLNEANVNTQDMKDVTGIQDASLGIRSNEVSGRAINARQREGDIAALTYYDNGDASVLEAGDVINQLIGQVYDGTRVVRVVGQDESVKFLRINDPMDPKSPDLSVGQYDVALTIGTSYSTRRVEAAQAMMDALQVYPELMQIAGDIIVKAQDWPGSDKLSERIKKTIPQNLLDDDEKDPNAQPAISPQQIQEALQMLQQLQAENAELKATKIVEIEKLKIDTYKAQTDRLRALSDNIVDQNTYEQNAIKDILDHSLSVDQHHLDILETVLTAQNQSEANQQKAQQANKANSTPGS